MAVWLCAIFGLVCLGFALNGFFALGSITDPEVRDASLGYAGFWSFLALIAAIFGVLSWMISRGRFGPVE